MYLDHFGMRELPFTLTPNTEFYLSLKGHYQALDQIRAALRRGEKMVKIVGDSGTGKTLLCRRMVEEISDRYLCAFLNDPYLTPRAALINILEEYNIDGARPDSLEQLLFLARDALLEKKAQGKQLVVLVDEAHVIPGKTLLTLAELAGMTYRDRPLVQIVLFGQPELDDMLAQESLRVLRDDLNISFALPKLKEAEVSSYLNHRLSKAGMLRPDLFTPEAIVVLSANSQGIPKNINILAHQSLLLAKATNALQVTDKHLLRVAADALRNSNNGKIMTKRFWNDITSTGPSLKTFTMISSSIALLAVFTLVMA